MVDWSPVLVGLGAVLAAIAAAIPTLVQTRRNFSAISRVEAQTNSRLTEALARIQALEKELAKR